MNNSEYPIRGAARTYPSTRGVLVMNPFRDAACGVCTHTVYFADRKRRR
jgi:hypothetical protein